MSSRCSVVPSKQKCHDWRPLFRATKRLLKSDKQNRSEVRAFSIITLLPPWENRHVSEAFCGERRAWRIHGRLWLAGAMRSVTTAFKEASSGTQEHTRQRRAFGLHSHAPVRRSKAKANIRFGQYPCQPIKRRHRLRLARPPHTPLLFFSGRHCAAGTCGCSGRSPH